MKIEWLGHSSFRLTESTGLSIVTDPFDASQVGITFPDVSADVVTVSHHHFDHDAVSAVKNYNTVIDEPGSFELGDDRVAVYGFKSYHDKKQGALRGKNTIYKFHMDGVDVCHMGDIGEPLTHMMAELIGSVNVLLIPVGGRFTIDAVEAKEYIDMLMPDVVIPMHYMMDGYLTEFDELKDFLSLFPEEDIEYAEDTSLIFDRNDFDGEKTRIIVCKKL